MYSAKFDLISVTMPATIPQFRISDEPESIASCGMPVSVSISLVCNAATMRRSKASSHRKWLRPPDATTATRAGLEDAASALAILVPTS